MDEESRPWDESGAQPVRDLQRALTAAYRLGTGLPQGKHDPDCTLVGEHEYHARWDPSTGLRIWR